MKNIEISEGHWQGLNPDVQTRLTGMADEYYAETGEPLKVRSGYRTTEQQAELYAADPYSGYVAPPGSSLHETGMAVDLDKGQVSKLEDLNIIDKYFKRPLMGGRVHEPWHLVHPEAKVARGRGILERISDFLGPSSAEAADNLEVPYMIRRKTGEESELRELLTEYGISTTPPAGLVGKTTPKTTLEEGIAMAPFPQMTKEAATAKAKAIEGADPGLKDPWIDPTNIIAAFGSGIVTRGLGVALRSVLGNVIGEVAGGMVGESLETEGKPRLAWVGSLAVDMALGMATDKMIAKTAAKIKRVWPTLSDEDTVNLINKAMGSAELQETVTRVKAMDPKAKKQAQQKAESYWSQFWGDESGQVGPIGTVKKPAEVDLSALGDPKKPAFSILPYEEGKAKQVLEGVQPKPEPVGIGEKYAVNINLNRIESADDIKNIISQMTKLEPVEIDVARRGVITNKETEALAELTGMTVDKLMARRVGQAFNAEEAVAARRLLVSSATQLKELANKATGVDSSEVDLLAFRRAMTVHAGIQQQVAGMTAEAGRTLQAYRIMAGETTMASRAVREWIEAGGGADATRRMAEMVGALETPEQISRVAAKAWKATTWDVFMEIWINGLLSNPTTHAVNTLSNALTALVQIPERYIASQIGRLTGSQGVQAGEAAAQFWGMTEGFKDGLVIAAKVLRRGEVSGKFGKLGKVELPQNAISGAALDITGVPGRAVDFIGEAIRIPGRLLVTEDEFFKAVGYRMELHAQALRTATQEGLTGTAAATRIQEILADPPENIKLSAIDAAAYQTFTKSAGPIATAVMAAASKVPMIRLVVPFIRTPSNIFRFTLERTPIAPLMTSVRADIMAGGARRDLALARIAMGSMIQATFAGLTAAGVVTGGGPKEAELRGNLEREGWQPYSIKVGNTYYSYKRLDPLGTVVGMAADFVEICAQAPEKQADELAVAIAAATGQVFVNRTYLKGAATLIEALTDPNRYGRTYLQQFAGSLVPFTGLTGQIERMDDPKIRTTRAGRESFLPAVQTMINEMKSRMPGFSKDLPPDRNLWGEPRYIPGGLGPDIISPIYATTKKHSPVDEEMIRNKVAVQMPARAIMGTDLTMQEFDKYVWLAGNGLKNADNQGCKDRLLELVKSPEYKEQTDGPEGGKALMIKKVILAYRQAAQVKMLEEFPELKELVIKNKREKIGKLVPGLTIENQ